MKKHNIIILSIILAIVVAVSASVGIYAWWYGNVEHTEQLSDFLKAIQTGGTPLITLEAGRQTVELITGIYRSMRDGKPVRFPLKPEYGTDFDGRLK